MADHPHAGRFLQAGTERDDPFHCTTSAPGTLIGGLQKKSPTSFLKRGNGL